MQKKGEEKKREQAEKGHEGKGGGEKARGCRREKLERKRKEKKRKKSRDEHGASLFQRGRVSENADVSPSASILPSPRLLLRYHRRRIWQEYAIISASSIWWSLLSIHHTCRFLRRIYLDTFASRTKLSRLFAHRHRRAGLNLQIGSKICPPTSDVDTSKNEQRIIMVTARILWSTLCWTQFTSLPVIKCRFQYVIVFSVV